MIAIAFFCVFCNGGKSMKATSAGAVLGDCVTAFFSPDKARRRGVGLTARAGLKVGGKSQAIKNRPRAVDWNGVPIVTWLRLQSPVGKA